MFPTTTQLGKHSNMATPPGNQQQQRPQPKKRRRRRRDGEEDEPVLRTTCDNCTVAKVKCNGARPCVRCTNKAISCEYTYKKRCGPKRRKGKEAEAARARASSDTEGLLASCRSRGKGSGRSGGHLDKAMGSMSVVIGKEEAECVRVFMQNVNAFTPLTTLETVKQAANAGSGAAARSGGEGAHQKPQPQNEEADQKHHARKAVLHGAIAVGAEFLEMEEASQTHAQIARQEIKECFDAAEPELVGAYLILALYWMHQMDSVKIARYIGLAHQSNGIISKPPPELVSSLTFISVILFDAHVVSTVGCCVDPPGPTLSPSARASPVASQERVLKILSFVLLAIRNCVDPTNDPTLSTGEWNAVALARHVDNAKALLDGASGPNDMARCVVVMLQAYFLLLRDDHRKAVVITEPLADLVADNPLVLHLPIVWVAISCVRALLDSATRTIAVERLESAMEPLAPRLAFASQESVVGRELLRVFNKKKDRGTRNGAGAGVASSSAPSRTPTAESILIRQSRVQTSSLNVTASDVHHPRPSVVDLLPVEPSPAPQRRGPPKLLRDSRSMDSGGGTLSASLLSETLASSNKSIRSSSAPAQHSSRLGPGPGSGPGLLNPEPLPFGRAAVSMLQLDSSSYGGSSFMGTAVPDVHVSESQSRDMAEDEDEMKAEMAESVEAGGGEAGREEDVSGGEDLYGGIDPKLLSGARGLISRQHQQQSFNANEEMLEGIDSKMVTDARDLISRQHMQQSFNANAAVSLEQVESNLTQLRVSSDGEGRPALGRRINSLDLEAAADKLLEARSSFIS